MLHSIRFGIHETNLSYAPRSRRTCSVGESGWFKREEDQRDEQEERSKISQLDPIKHQSVE